MISKIKILCECGSVECNEHIMMNPCDYKTGYVYISNTCPFGAEETDIFIENRNGYVIYSEGKPK